MIGRPAAEVGLWYKRQSEALMPRVKVPTIPNVPDIADTIQKALDQLFVKYPELSQYIEWLKYVPQGAELPPGTTHTLKFANLTGDDLVVAVRGEGIYVFLANTLLAVL